MFVFKLLETALVEICKNVQVREDYFVRLFSLAKERLNKHFEKEDYAFILAYTGNLTDGTIAKFAELDSDIFRHYIVDQLWGENIVKLKAVELSDNDSAETMPSLWDDIFVALGHDLVDFYPVTDDGEALVGVEHLFELNKVWDAPNPECPPLRELIAILRNLNLKNKK